MKCKMNNCDNEEFCRGYCREHYWQYKHMGLFKTGICSVEGCERGVHAKGLCPLHYEQFKTTGIIKTK